MKTQCTYHFTASKFQLITRRQRNHPSFLQSLLHTKPFSSKYATHDWNMKSVCATGKILLQILKVDLWFQRVVLCLGHRQMPKLFFNVHFPLGKMPSHNILCDIPGGKLWPHLFHGKVSDTECKLKGTIHITHKFKDNWSQVVWFYCVYWKGDLHSEITSWCNLLVEPSVLIPWTFF